MNGFVSDFSLFNSSFDELELRRYARSLPSFISYFVSRRIKPHTKVGLLFPKYLLRSVLPSLSDSVVVKGSYIPGYKTVQDLSDCDLVLGEPVGFNDHGFIVHKDESAHWDENVLACSSLASFSDQVPAACDLISGGKVVVEKGLLHLHHASFLQRPRF